MQELRNQRYNSDSDQGFSADQHLDADLRRALKFSAQVTPQQHQAARERLLRRAAVEQMPLEVVAPPQLSYAALREHAETLRQYAVGFMNFLFVDTGAYERARRLPAHYRHYNVHGRYAFTVIHMSA